MRFWPARPKDGDGRSFFGDEEGYLWSKRGRLTGDVAASIIRLRAGDRHALAGFSPSTRRPSLTGLGWNWTGFISFFLLVSIYKRGRIGRSIGASRCSGWTGKWREDGKARPVLIVLNPAGKDWGKTRQITPTTVSIVNKKISGGKWAIE